MSPVLAPAVAMPDPVAIAVRYLTDHPAISALGARISADLVGYRTGQRWITVTVTGGTRPIPYRLDAPRLDLNCYAETRPAAHRLTEVAYTALLAMPGYTTRDAVVTAVEPGTRPADLTDPLNEQPRYVADVTVWIRTSDDPTPSPDDRQSTRR